MINEIWQKTDDTSKEPKFSQKNSSFNKLIYSWRPKDFLKTNGSWKTFFWARIVSNTGEIIT